jgi:hypothetical protein
MGPGIGAPGQEFLRGAVIGSPGVRVADVGGEEFEEAHEARSPAAVTKAGSVGELIVTSWFIRSPNQFSCWLLVDCFPTRRAPAESARVLDD